MATEKYLSESIIPSIKSKVEAKQDKLVGSGEGQNLKTVNGQSLLGTGDIEVVSKLYEATGANADGAMTQKATTDAIQAVDTKVTAVQDSITSAQGDIEALEGFAENVVQLDTTLKPSDASTVTLIKKQAALNNTTASTETEIPLPVASETQAGVINSATYQSIQDSAEKIETLLNAAVSVDGLPAEPTQQQLTTAWKTAAGRDELINGAKILDTTNNKTWTYYTNSGAWTSVDNNNPTIELKNFTNTAAGQIKGDNTTDGKVQAEADGTGSVKGWDTVKTDIANNATSISTNATNISSLQSNKQDKLISTGEGQNLKTVNGQSLLGAGDVLIDEPVAITSAEFEAAWEAAA